MPQWLQAVRSTTISGGPSAVTPQDVASSIASPSAPCLKSMSPSWCATASFLDDQPALHLEMERRAELGAVVAVAAGAVGGERHGRGLARIQADHDVLGRHREPVRRVG